MTNYFKTMHALLNIIRELAIPFYAGLLLLAYVLGFHVRAQRAMPKKVVPGSLLRLWEYLANAEDAAADTGARRKLVP